MLLLYGGPKANKQQLFKIQLNQIQRAACLSIQGTMPCTPTLAMEEEVGFTL